MVEKNTGSQETIAAIATAPGTGGIGVIRVSGPAAGSVAQRITKKKPTPRKAELVDFYDPAGEVIDIGLAIYFSAPNSFTGEDVLELQGHGGDVVLNMVLNAVLACSDERELIRLAGPGEFSARAFANNKLDLTQAEAIADLVTAQSTMAARAAVRSLRGAFSKQIHRLVEGLINLRMHVEAAIDFSEDVVEDAVQEATAITAKLTQLITDCVQILQEAEYSQLVSTGVQVVVLGLPNAGKSSLLNLIAGDDLAIVTDVPGTTRDLIRAKINLQGISVELLDTAGIAETKDVVELEGIRRAWNVANAAQIVIWLQDITTWTGMVEIPKQLAAEAKILLVLNKLDLIDQNTFGEFENLGVQPDPRVAGLLKISAKTGAGKEELIGSLLRLITKDKLVGLEPAFIARKRHVVALQEALQHLRLGLVVIQNLSGTDLLAEELRLAQQFLGEITGTFGVEELLEKIFAEFCIGK